MRRAGSLVPMLLLLLGCPSGDDDDDADQGPVLDPEPAGAPDDVADGLDEQGQTTLGCLGDNAPEAPSASHVTLPGWIMSWADPSNHAETPPDAAAEVYDEAGSWLASSASDMVSGRIAITVPVREIGFIGTVMVRPIDAADGYLQQRFVSSRPVTDTDQAGWTWLVTREEIDAMAAQAGVEIDPAKGIVAGAVHDCDGFGVANAVIRHAASTEGVFHFDEGGDPIAFALAPGRTFTTETGRFAIPNVEPGTVTVEAFGRAEPDGPLVLLSTADVVITADVVTAVALQPRVGLLR